jgi:hypothetical protein
MQNFHGLLLCQNKCILFRSYKILEISEFRIIQNVQELPPQMKKRVIVEKRHPKFGQSELSITKVG